MNKKQSNKEYYTERLNVITEYINDNLDGKLTLGELSKRSHFSPFHFHKITRALLKEPIGAYISRIRLEKAAHLFQYSHNSIEQISYGIGYETPSSLSKQFKNHFGVSPTEYRNGKRTNTQKLKRMDTELDIKNPKMVTLEKKQAIYIKLQGSYQHLDFAGAWEKLWSVVKGQKLFTAGIEHVGISYDDPNLTAADKIRYDACLVIHKEAKPEGIVGIKTLKEGKFAMFHYTGSYTNLSAVYDYIFNEWLLNSDHELRDEPVREKYRNNPQRTEESKLKTEIYLPIK